MARVFNLKSWLIGALRRASYRYPARYNALKAAKVERNSYRCAKCAQLFPRKSIQLDHVLPVIPITGWDSWDGYISRMFVEENGFQVLCISCHEAKSIGENAERRKLKGGSEKSSVKKKRQKS